MGRKQRKIGIYGMGAAAEMVFRALKKLQITVDFILDGNPDNIGVTFCEKKVVNLYTLPKDVLVLIAANPKYEIHKCLKAAGLQWYMYVDPEFLHLYSEGYSKDRIGYILKKNRHKIQMVYDMLEDKKSKNIFSTILRHRMRHDVESVYAICDENQYFGNDVVPYVAGNFVDCGAFVGDTLKRFLKQVGDADYHYYAFEAEMQNYVNIVEYCKKNNLTNVKAYNLAVWNEKKNLAFLRDDSTEKVGGKVAEIDNSKEIYISADSIDHILDNIDIHMITMDIEGAERYALQGAKNSIYSCHPKLAISIYHSLEDIWEIPLLIKKINPNYRIFCRHHRWNMHDTVCYAL